MKRSALFLLMVVAACGDSTEPAPAPNELLTSLPRALTADELRASDAANDFALRLFRRLNETQPDSNIFVSPLSVTFALGMTMNGAAGTTLDEMRATLGFGADALSTINAGYRGLMGLELGLDPNTKFEIANSVWQRSTFPVLQSFKDSVQQVFSAEVKSAPFDASTVTAINSWVSANTAGKIPTILNSIGPNDLMYLINAIYFKGTWREQFDPAKTVPMSFNGVGGVQQVPGMNHASGEASVRTRSTLEAHVGELMYGNGAFVMTIVLPAGDINALAATLDTATWRALSDSLYTGSVSLRLPKFTMEYTRPLVDDLKALGMQVPFTDLADFSGITPGGGVMITDVLHKTFVSVNEEGTEAAAVTKVTVGPTSGGGCFCVDKPFLFVIRERFSGTILFMGKIVRIPS